MVKRNFFGVYKGIELTTNGCEGNHNHFTGIEMDYKNGEVKISYCMFCWYLWYLMDRMLWTVVCYSNTHIWYVGITSYLRSFIVIYIYVHYKPTILGISHFRKPTNIYTWHPVISLCHEVSVAPSSSVGRHTGPRIYCAMMCRGGVGAIKHGKFFMGFSWDFFWGFTLTIHYN
jgi:hypothetical protein